MGMKIGMNIMTMRGLWPRRMDAKGFSLQIERCRRTHGGHIHRRERTGDQDRDHDKARLTFLETTPPPGCHATRRLLERAAILAQRMRPLKGLGRGGPATLILWSLGEKSWPGAHTRRAIRPTIELLCVALLLSFACSVYPPLVCRWRFAPPRTQPAGPESRSRIRRLLSPDPP